jgi:hypothetical protein
MLIEGRLSGDQIVRPVVKFDQALEAYPRIAADPETYIKLGVEY